MTASTVDLSDFALWRNGFPDDVFTELRRSRPLFRHGLTPGVAKIVKRDFWMTTKHRHAVRLHRDDESFTAVNGPLIQPADLFSSYPTIISWTRRAEQTPQAHLECVQPARDRQTRRRHPGPRVADDRRPARRGSGDWIDDVADALPMTVIGDIIGIPEQDRPRIFDSLDHILKARSPGSKLSRKMESTCSRRSSATRWS